MQGERTSAAKRAPKISTVLFDLGGTLVDTLDPEGWVDAASKVLVEVRAEDLAQAFVTLERETDRSPPVSDVRFWQLTLERATGRTITEATAERFLQADRARERVLPLYSDTRRCLEQLRLEGRRLGVLSNSRGEAHVRQILARGGIEEFFPTVISSGTEGVAKPDPEIFRRALARHKVTAEETFYVGNLAFTDAKAAAAVGLHSVWLNRAGTGFGDDPPEITSLLEVPLWIRRLETGR
jgi:putative hydrolase of the HAD superfamily